MIMNEKKEYRQEYLTGERALFQGEHLRIVDTIFADGESPLKESRDIELQNCMFQWKYPLWYAKDVSVKDCTWLEMGRAGVWYTQRVTVEDSAVEAPKNFRRCRERNAPISPIWTSCLPVSESRSNDRGGLFPRGRGSH